MNEYSQSSSYSDYRNYRYGYGRRFRNQDRTYGSTYNDNRRFADYYDTYYGEPARNVIKRNVDRYGGLRDGYTIGNMVEEDVPMNLYEYQ